MQTTLFTRRDFLKTSSELALVTCPLAHTVAAIPGVVQGTRPTVSIVRIHGGKTAAAVEEAVDLLGGIAEVTRGRNRILLKPNLVINEARCTTKPEVVGTLARLMKGAGKDVSIGEASVIGSTRCQDVLGPYQASFFDNLGYTALAKSLGIPLVNLHLGPFVTLPVPDGLFWEELVLNQQLVETDLLCSVAMMKTHTYATVTLSLKNAIGLYPGGIYGSYRWWVHDNAFLKKSPGVAFEILDMVRVNKFGFSVIDASTAMEGNGPIDGTLVPMNLILAGTDPLATDMVGAEVMGIPAHQVPTLVWAHRLGMKPASLDEIEIRGTPIAEVQRRFIRASLYTPGSGGTDTPLPAPVPQVRVLGQARAAVEWNETAPRAVLRYNSAGKARVEWANQPTQRTSILEKNTTLQTSGWKPVKPTAPGHHEFDPSEAAQTYFRLRQP